ncbi:MAG: NAD(P)/FAD-dependent oxidoreductase [Nitrososphaera sp.]|uniref:NAD(P)/FAD-dependent oxidoreductase n=1 Tax=Nitrososphaera sp. TaxID=1971748 RepID=UPI003D6F586D
MEYKVAVIGGGVLGTSIAYFLAGEARNPASIALIEQESDIARHTSSRNTGKVHAPFLYDPVKKKLFAKAASLGFEMWQAFARAKGLPFKQDGVLEVATDDRGIDRLQKYMAWGEANGLAKSELQLLDKRQVAEIEPAVRCESAILCTRDGSVDYGAFSQALLQDIRSFGGTVLLGHRAGRIALDGTIATAQGRRIKAQFIINAAGGMAVDVAHAMGVAKEYTDLHFRGEYWQAPEQYRDLTKLSIYSVPRHPEYPFLDPHWIVRADGRREVGPNAVPVFGPYAYGHGRNLADMIPKILESSRTGVRRVFLDRQFISLASTELKSSLSKTAMINRVREFLPAIRPSAFTIRGTAGIRSSVIDSHGRFVPDTLILEHGSSINVINYNSPGATGALPIAAKVSAQILEKGLIESGGKRTLWNPVDIATRL